MLEPRVFALWLRDVAIGFVFSQQYPTPDLLALESSLQWPRRLGWSTGVVAFLADVCQKGRLPVRASRELALESPCLAAWILQDKPETKHDFFTPERVLSNWGRVGRRISRRWGWGGFFARCDLRQELI